MNKQERINDMLNLESRMSKWKQAQPLDFVNKATQNYNFPNWQTGNDESVYYNLNIASFFKTRIVMPPAVTSILERDLQPELLDISFNNVDGSTNPTLEEYLKGPKQVQAMMMAHKGKVVFETYPGMNPSDLHVWMSASKTTASLMLTLLWEEGNWTLIIWYLRMYPN
jgi:hypothetical protein